MILPEIFILLGICMLLLMSLAERCKNDTALSPAKKSFNSIFHAQINAVNIWFEYGAARKVENDTYSQDLPGSRRAQRSHKGHKENAIVMATFRQIIVYSFVFFVSSLCSS